MNPSPDTTYVVHTNGTSAVDGSTAHVFHTDHLGRTDLAYVERLSLGDADRSQSVQSRVGHEGGDGFVGAHLLANGFGGGGEYLNMVSMLRELNGGAGKTYFNLENGWRRQLSEVPPPSIEVRIEPVYSGSGTVPDRVIVQYWVDGAKSWRNFTNG